MFAKEKENSKMADNITRSVWVDKLCGRPEQEFAGVTRSIEVGMYKPALRRSPRGQVNDVKQTNYSIRRICLITHHSTSSNVFSLSDTRGL